MGVQNDVAIEFKSGEVETSLQPPTPIKKKRGRKPNPNKPKMYFSDREEEAFKEYLTTNDELKKNKLFKNILYPAFSTMVESILRRYNLFKPGEEFDDTFNDVMSHLISKVANFDPSKNKKAYSYCGTICKNYALHERKKAIERLADTLSYENVFNVYNPDLRTTNEKDIDAYNFNQIIMIKMAKEIECMVQTPKIHGLNEDDVKVGIALVDILINWDTIFHEIENRKYNRNQIDFFLKEVTSLSTTQVRHSKKKFAEIYFKVKEEMLNR